jgi:hypothetical protein
MSASSGPALVRQRHVAGGPYALQQPARRLCCSCAQAGTASQRLLLILPLLVPRQVGNLEAQLRSKDKLIEQLKVMQSGHTSPFDSPVMASLETTGANLGAQLRAGCCSSI